MQSARKAGRSVSARQTRREHLDKIERLQRRTELFRERLNVVYPVLDLLDRITKNRILVVLVMVVVVKLVGLDVITKVSPLVR